MPDEHFSKDALFLLLKYFYLQGPLECKKLTVFLSSDLKSYFLYSIVCHTIVAILSSHKNFSYSSKTKWRGFLGLILWKYMKHPSPSPFVIFFKDWNDCSVLILFVVWNKWWKCAIMFWSANGCSNKNLTTQRIRR